MSKINFNELDITKDFILSRITEKDIFDKYIGVPYKLGELIKSNLRNNDDTNSLNVFKFNGELRYKDFGHSYGNCFEFVKQLYNCDYYKALEIIANDFNLIPGITKKIYAEQPKTNFVEDQFKKKLHYIKRPWKLEDLYYWGRYYIPIHLLVKYKIEPCKYLYLQKSKDLIVKVYDYIENDPLYIYNIGGNHKCYRPLTTNKKYKWFSTTTLFDIQGLEQLPEKGELLIITSSMKDLLVLKVLGYNAIALGGEGNHIPDKILDYLKACFKEIIIFYDNDKPGIKYGQEMSDRINCPYIHIPIECEDQKDISDFVEAYGLEEGDKLMKKLLNE